MPIKFVTPYGDNTHSKQPKRLPFTSTQKSLTRQSMKDECDVNVIIRRFHKTGLVDHLNVHEGQYGDFAEIDYHEALNTVREADHMFLTLPSDVRTRFDNDPGKFLEFSTNPDNLDAMRELGLAYPAEQIEEPAQAAPEPPKEDVT